MGLGYWLCQGSLNINRDVNDKSRKQIPAIQFTCLCGSGTWHPSSAPIQVSHWQVLPLNMFVWLLSLNGCRHTKSTPTVLLHSELHSYIHPFHTHGLSSPGVLAFQAPTMCQQIIIVMARLCDNRPMNMTVDSEVVSWCLEELDRLS